MNHTVGCIFEKSFKEIVDPIINGHYEKENFCNKNYPIRNIFYLNRGDGSLAPLLENLGVRGC